jgi:hypothetical protein
VLGNRDRVAVLGQLLLDDGAIDRVVLDDEHAQRHLGSTAGLPPPPAS